MNQLKWSEPFEYVVAKMKSYSVFSRENTIVFLTSTGCFGFLVIFGTILNQRFEELMALLLFVLIGSFLLAYPIMWALSYIPDGVSITDTGIRSGKRWTKFDEIESATVGTIEYDSKIFYIFAFITKQNVLHKYALAKRINPKELQELLKSYNLNVVE